MRLILHMIQMKEEDDEKTQFFYLSIVCSSLSVCVCVFTPGKLDVKVISHDKNESQLRESGQCIQFVCSNNVIIIRYYFNWNSNSIFFVSIHCVRWDVKIVKHCYYDVDDANDYLPSV